MVFRQILSKLLLLELEKDLSRTVGREVAKMDCVGQMAPQVYGYRPKIGAFGGAFGSTVAPRQQHRLQRVDIPFNANQGLFHEF
mmetsp:Transcript_6139/g.12362  ORF Transcript_6139/g.12362 Transcript_6139/m.12362 type:complete len:84 (+) Transcript_6139:73-324(+)